jgi:hypothetical protein
MTLTELEAALDQRGSRLADWPAAEREAAGALLAVSPEARALFAAAAALDDLLAESRIGEAPPTAALVAAATALPQERPTAAPRPAARRRLPPRRSWRWAALAAAAVAGFVIGIADARPDRLPADFLELTFGSMGVLDDR